MKKVIVIGASGSLAKYVIDTLKNVPDVHLTLLARSKNRIANDTTNCTVFAFFEDFLNCFDHSPILYSQLFAN